MAIDFPNSPSTGDIHTVSGKQWQWDSEKWIAYGVSLAPDVLKVDSGNNRVGINQTTPTVALDVTGSARITGDLTVSGTTVTVDSASVLVKDRVQFEGATANDYETILVATDPTADRTITLPDSTGTVALSTGNVATATALATGRTINGVSFDGTANITVVDSAALPLAGGTLSGTVNAADQIIQRPVMKDYGETKVAMAAHAVDLSLGNVQTYTLSGNQTLTFTNPPATGTAGSFTLIVTNGASATLTWPTSVDWAGGTAPTLTASGIDILTFTTIDGGTIWYGFLAGADMK
jgi:hypothetical protein